MAFSQSINFGPLRVPGTLSGSPQSQDYFHNNTRMFFPFLTVLIYTGGTKAMVDTLLLPLHKSGQELQTLIVTMLGTTLYSQKRNGSRRGGEGRSHKNVLDEAVSIFLSLLNHDFYVAFSYSVYT